MNRDAQVNGAKRSHESHAPTSACWALVSGGGDSTAAALWAEEDPGFAGVVYIDTRTALPGGWPLTVLDSRRRAR